MQIDELFNIPEYKEHLRIYVEERGINFEALNDLEKREVRWAVLRKLKKQIEELWGNA